MQVAAIDSDDPAAETNDVGGGDSVDGRAVTELAGQVIAPALRAAARGDGAGVVRAEAQATTPASRPLTVSGALLQGSAPAQVAEPVAPNSPDRLPPQHFITPSS